MHEGGYKITGGLDLIWVALLPRDHHEMKEMKAIKIKIHRKSQWFAEELKFGKEGGKGIQRFSAGESWQVLMRSKHCWTLGSGKSWKEGPGEKKSGSEAEVAGFTNQQVRMYTRITHRVGGGEQAPGCWMLANPPSTQHHRDGRMRAHVRLFKSARK